MTSSVPISSTASDATSIQQLPNLNPGNEVLPANQSNQNAADLKPVEEIIGHESDSDDDDDIRLEELMTKLQEVGMNVLDRNALSMAISKAQNEGKLDDFVEKSSDAIVKAHFKVKKTKKDDDSDFTIDEKLKKHKTTVKSKA